MEQLRQQLLALDGKSYKSYKAITGEYRFDDFTLSIDHVQGDPFAQPSRISLRVDMARAALPEDVWRNPVRRVAAEDFLGRAVRQAITRNVKGQRGSGCSGQIRIATSGQQVLKRNAILIEAKHIEARLTMGLPAWDRRAAGHEALAMFFDELPRVIAASLLAENLDLNQLRRHVESVEDQDALRHWLGNEKLVAFIADGAILPRASGVDNHPLSEALPFRAPDSLARSVTLPNGGEIRGLGIPAGVSLIVGGGFHGKSTLLHALEYGVYNHIPGDGRERVVSLESAVKIRAEDGRSIARVDISPFITGLPFDRDTVDFCSENASGSTSQAANIVEALDCGAELLLIDEDTSATNFMIRDQRMQALVTNDKEPITPLIQRVRQLHRDHGISSIIVMGGSGDYFDVADTVIMMDSYQPIDASTAAHALARPLAQTGAGRPFGLGRKRRPGAEVLDPSRGNRAVSIKLRGRRNLLYGEHDIDLAQVEQLVDSGQTEAIGLMIHHYARHYADRHDHIGDGLRHLLADIEHAGLDRISEYKVGHLAMPRLYELTAAINRIREGRWQ